jgi:uncharacterized protein (TIGR01777 family)
MTLSNILISGASGMIGTSLLQFLSNQSIPVMRLTRGVSRPELREIHWNPYSALAGEKSPSIPESFGPLDAAIHLSGANVAGQPWTLEYRKKLRDSRVQTTLSLGEMLISLPKPPRVLLCASAIGIYGNRGDEILTEDSGPGEGFLADVCQEWESATGDVEAAGIRVVHLRFGVVLGRSGGMLNKLLPLFRMGLGGKLGNGRQWTSWIALPDLLRIVQFCMETESVRGAVNVVAPQPVRNAEFTSALGKVLGKPTMLPVPATALKVVFGTMANETMLSSLRVLPVRLVEAGFRFELGDIDSALRSQVPG